MGCVRSPLAALLCALMLAACGDGSGGGSATGSVSAGTPGAPPAPQSPPVAPPVTPGGAWLTLNPNPVRIKAYAGEMVAFQIDAIASRSFAQPFKVGVADTRGVVATSPVLMGSGGLTYTFEINTRALPAGSHSTWFELRLCEDDPAICKQPLPGSPWHVPLTVEVQAAAPLADRIVVAPAALDVVTQQGEPRSMHLFAHLGTFSKPFQMELFDSSGLIEPTSMYRANAGRHAVMLTTRRSLAPGVHSTTLEVRVCGDDPRVCQQPFPGSPYRIPLTVTVKATPNLTALAPLAGVPAWSSHNGNAAHTGHVPASFDPAAFSHRWTLEEPAGSTAKPPAAAGGRVFLVRGVHGGKWELAAVSEQGGELLWRLDLGTPQHVSPPAAGSDKVFVSTGAGGSQVFWAVDAASGRVAQRLERSSPAGPMLAATVFDDMVYTNGGAADGLVKFNARTNEVEWRTALAPSYTWSPAADVQYVYVYPDHQMHMFGTITGRRAFVYDLPVSSSNVGLVPMLAGPVTVLHGFGMLTALDMQAGGKRWEARSAGQPAVANGVVYGFGPGLNVLEARAVASGELQFQFQVPVVNGGWRFQQVLATSNLLFLSSDTATLAFDPASRQVAWTHPLGGDLALSDRGVLYIVSANGRVAAINLR